MVGLERTMDVIDTVVLALGILGAVVALGILLGEILSRLYP